MRAFIVAATSNAQRVRVRICRDQTMFLPTSVHRMSRPRPPVFLLQLLGQIQQVQNLSGEKSFKVRKLHPFRSMFLIMTNLHNA